MSTRTFVCATLCLLLAVPLLHADQTFRLSTGLDRVSTSFAMSINPLTGDMLFVFNQLDAIDRTFGRVYATLIRFKPATMDYAAGLPRQISVGDGWQGRPQVTWAVNVNRFAVVWDTRGVEGPEQRSSILGRILTAIGKPKGGVQTVLDNGDSNDFPQLISMFEGDDCEEPPPVNLQFLLAWNGNRPAGGNDRPTHGLNIAPMRITKRTIALLDDKFTRVEANKPGAGVGPYAEGGSGSSRLRTINGEKTLSLGVSLAGFRYQESGGTYHEQGFSYRLSLDAGQGYAVVQSETDMPLDSFTPSMLGVSPTGSRWDTLFAIARDGNTGFLNAYLRQDDLWSAPNPITINGYQVIDGSVVRAPRIWQQNAPGNAPAAKKTVYGYLVVAAKDGWVYAQRITDEGAFLKKPKKLFSHGNQLQSMQVYRIDREGGKFNTLIIWQKKVDDDLHEAWAWFTNLK